MPDTVNVKISELPSASTPGNNDVLAGVQSSTTKKFAFSSIKTWIQGWIAKSDVGLGNVANVLQYSASNKPSPADLGAQTAIDGGTITLSLSWSGSGPWTQTVTVTGATVTSNSRIDLQPTAAQLASLMADGVAAMTVENNAGTLTAYALGAAPTTAVSIACTVTEVVV